MGFFGVTPESVLPYKKKGFTLLTIGMDTAFLINAAQEMLSKMKK
jgi:2-keto-3-deoxy-L-rhamnonate aldolase RhmA